VTAGKDTRKLGLALDAPGRIVSATPDFEWLAVAVWGDNRFGVFHLGRFLGNVQLDSFVDVDSRGYSVAALSPDGRLLAATGFGSDARIQIFEVAGLSRRLTIPVKWGRAKHLAFSEDGRFLAATHDDGTVLVWDTRVEK
jgi:WD40 repeat protein